MLKAGFTKEFLYFLRTKKLMIIAIVVFALAVLDPILMWGMTQLLTSMGDVASEAAASVYEDVTVGISYNARYGVLMSVGDLTNTVSLITMLVLMQTAGGELKKRATIIPNCAGLTPKAYLMPKFILYPLFMFAVTFVAMIISYLMSTILFVEGFPLTDALLAALGAGAYAMFLNALYLCIGLSMAKAGAATAICYGGATILNMVLTSLGAQKFHPFALLSEAQNAVTGEADLLNLFGSLGVTVLIIGALYLVTLLALTARRVDNIGVDNGEL